MFFGLFLIDEPIYAADVHPNDKTLLVTGGGDDWARLIRYEHMTEEYRVVAELGPHNDSVIAAKFSHDGALLATGSMDGQVKVWKGLTGEPVHVLEGPSELVWMTWHPRGNVIAAGSEDGTIWMWKADNGTCMKVFSGNAIRSTAGCFSPDGKWLVSAGEGLVQVWNPKEDQAHVTYDRSRGHPIPEGEFISLAINPQSNLIAAGCIDGQVVILHLQHQQIVKTLNVHADAVEGLSFHPNPKFNYLVSASLDGQIVIWDMNTFVIRTKCLNGEEDGITALLWLADPDTFITSSVSGMVSVWDGKSGAILDQMGLKDVPCLSVVPIPTKQLLFCGYDNGRLLSFAYN